MPVYKKVNKNFFKKWSSEMAYALGFFFADGSHDVNPRGSEYFSFQICDQRLLEEIRKALRSDHRIAVRKPRNKNERALYRLQIGSKEMCADLRNLGVLTAKADAMSLPNIPQRYFNDFVRGYFDGDGNVWSGVIHKERKTQHVVLFTGFTSASKSFLLDLHTKLKCNGLEGGGVYCKKEAFCIKYSTTDSLKLQGIMYNGLGDSKLYLPRKKQVFDAFLCQKNIKQLRW